jgi:uncharacterized protein (DUF2164 family)
MSKYNFTKEQKDNIVQKIKLYYQSEFSENIGQFDAEFLLEFFAKEIGNYFYNQGLQDASKAINTHIDAINDTLYTMEEPTL